MKPEFYYLKVTTTNCQVKCYLNGFPVYELNTEGQTTNQIPINLYLKGKKNKLDIWIQPYDGSGKVEASCYLYGHSDIVSSDDKQKDREVFVVESSGAAKTTTFYFDNEKFDFSHLFSNAPVIHDEKKVISYAGKLLKIIEKQNVKQLIAEMEPKINDYAEAFSAPKSMLISSLEEQLQPMITHKKLKKAVIDEITAVSLCDGRIWEIKIKPDLPFFYIPEKDGASYLKVYVALIDGQFGIVR